MTHCSALFRYIRKHFWDLGKTECITQTCEWCNSTRQLSNELYNHMHFMDTYFPEWLERWEEAERSDNENFLSPMTVTASNVLRRLFEKKPELFDMVMQQVNEYYKLSEIQHTIKQIQRKQASKIEAPDGIFDVVVVDPPWESHSGDYNPIAHRGPPTYETMSVEEIKKLQLPLTEDAIVWLWTINYYLRDAYDVLDRWGLTYRSILVWVKPHIGLGKWLRNRAEFCLVATKGNPNWYLSNQSNVLEAPRREHSRKPDEFYELVGTLCVGKKLDMFAREPREGWDVWGAEVELFA